MSFRKTFLLYLISTGLSASVPIVLMPVLTRSLTPSDYGQMAMLLTLVSILTPVINFGTLPYLGVAFHREDHAQLRRTLSSIVAIPPMMTVLIMSLSLVVREKMAESLSLPPSLITLAAPIALSMTLPQMMLVLLRMRNEAGSYAKIEIAGAALNLILTMLFLLSIGQGWLSRAQAMALTGLILTVFSVLWLRRIDLLGGKRDRATVRDVLNFGAGVVPHDVANQALRIVDRIMIMTIMGAAAAGEYAVAAQFASIMMLVLSAFNRAWTPFLFARLREDSAEANRQIVRAMRWAIAGMVAGWALFLVITLSLFRLLVDGRYHEAIMPTIWIATGYLFMGIYLTYVDNIFYLKKTHYLSMVTGAAVAINTLLSYLCIHRFGVNGAGISFAATSAVIMVFVLVIVQRLRPLPWVVLLR